MNDDLETRLAAALRAAAEQRSVEDRWDRITEHPSRSEPSVRRTLRRSLPILVAAAVIVIGLAVAAVIVTPRGGRVAGVTDEVATTSATTSPAASSAATPSGSASGSTSIDLPTSDWAGGAGMGAALGGILRLDADGCVRVNDRYVVWPKGFSAGTVGGALELRDANGTVVARGGDEIFTGGGGSPRDVPGDCGGPADQVFLVQSGIDVYFAVPTTGLRTEKPGPDVLEGVLRRDADGCFRIGDSYLSWPAGSRGVVGGGRARVDSVGSTGDRLAVTGVAGGDHDATPCAPDGTTFVVHTVNTVGSPVALPTSGWMPGSGGGSAGLTGVAALDDDLCLVIGDRHVAWPAGFRVWTSYGKAEITDINGNVVFYSGENVTVTGAEGSVMDRPEWQAACAPNDGTFLVQSEITVVG